MDRTLEQLVRARAADRCEYCHLPESTSPLRHVIDHIIARQHGGRTELANLALSCGRCNRFKGPNLAGFDPDTGSVVPLFHPRIQIWSEHFRYDGATLIGVTSVGRATVAALSINLPLRVAARQALIESGVRL